MRKLLVAASILFPVVTLLSYMREPTRRRPRFVALLGDSLAVGLTHPMRTLAAASGIGFAADAEAGASVLHFPPERVRTDVLLADTVIVSLGGNDRLATWRAGELTGAVEAFVRAAAERGAIVYWVDMPFPTLEDRTGVSTLWRSAARPVDVGSAERWAPARASDGVHLTPSGYADLARVVWDVVAD